MKARKASVVFLLALYGFFMPGCPDSDSSDSGSNIIVEFTSVKSSFLTKWGMSINKWKAAQGFRVSADDACSSVELLLGAHNGSPSGDYIVELQTDNAGFPSGTLLSPQASASMNIGSLSQNAWNTWPFDVPIPLSAGQTCWIVCRTTEATSDSYVNLTGNATDSYPDGLAMFSLDEAPWTKILKGDICFRIIR